MKSKKFRLFCFVSVIGAALALLLAGCGSGKADHENVIGKTFVYEKEGFYGDFTISIKDDGTFTYYEGMASSYLGIGEWTIGQNTLTLTNEVPSIDGSRTITNAFEIEKGKLIWRAEGSDNFTYVKVEDGEAFKEK